MLLGPILLGTNKAPLTARFPFPLTVVALTLTLHGKQTLSLPWY